MANETEWALYSSTRTDPNFVGKTRDSLPFRKFGRFLVNVYCALFCGQILEWAVYLGAYVSRGIWRDGIYVGQTLDDLQRFSGDFFDDSEVRKSESVTGLFLKKNKIVLKAFRRWWRSNGWWGKFRLFEPEFRQSQFWRARSEEEFGDRGHPKTM